jgi:hypothetical protein
MSYRRRPSRQTVRTVRTGGPGWRLWRAGSCARRPTARRTTSWRRTRRQPARKQETPSRTTPASGSRPPCPHRASLPSPGTRAWTTPSRTRNRPRPTAKSIVSPSAQPRPIPHPCCPKRPQSTGCLDGKSWPPRRSSTRRGPCGAGPAGRASRRGAPARGRGGFRSAVARGRPPSACGLRRKSRGTSIRRTAFISRLRPTPGQPRITPGPRPRPLHPRPRPLRPGPRQCALSPVHGRGSRTVTRPSHRPSRPGRLSKLARRSFRRRGHRSGRRSGSPWVATSGRDPPRPSR